MFKVGQKVVCVDAYCEELRLGAVYVVTGIDTCCTEWISIGIPDDGSGEPCYCGSVVHSSEIYFDGTNFRPIDELTDQVDRIEREGCPSELVKELQNTLQHANN